MRGAAGQDRAGLGVVDLATAGAKSAVGRERLFLGRAAGLNWILKWYRLPGSNGGPLRVRPGAVECESRLEKCGAG
jgi:hypothetical protein